MGIYSSRILKEGCNNFSSTLYEDKYESSVSPLEEAYNIIYESEHNYNQILRCIGLNELHSFARGEELVFTEADTIGFLESFKKWLKTMLDKIREWFEGHITKIRDYFNIDKNFVTKHANEIRRGYEFYTLSKEDKEIEGYAFLPLPSFEGIDNKVSEEFFSNDNLASYAIETRRKMLDSLGAGEPLNLDNSAHEAKALKLMHVHNRANSIADLSEKLNNYLRGERIKISISKHSIASADAIIKRLSTNFIKEVEKRYNNIRNEINGVIKFLDEQYKYFDKMNPSLEVRSKGIMVIEYIMADIKAALRVSNIKSAAYISAVNARATQDRKLANMYYNAGKEE